MHARPPGEGSFFHADPQIGGERFAVDASLIGPTSIASDRCRARKADNIRLGWKVSPPLFTIGIVKIGNPACCRPRLHFSARQDAGFGAHDRFSPCQVRIDSFREPQTRRVFFYPHDHRANGLEAADCYEDGCPNL